MFVIGICVGPSDRFERIAEPAITRWMPTSEVIALPDQPSIFAAYNRILERAELLDNVEGIILIHDDVEIRGDLAPPLRQVFADSSIGLVGVVGGAGEGRGMAWFSRADWYGDVDGGGFANPDSYRWGDVDVVDGFFMALRSDLASKIRFDLEDCTGFHRYDAELSSIVKALGLRIVAHPLPVSHRNAGMYGSVESYVSWARSNLQWRAKWLHLGPCSRCISRVRIWLMPLELRLRPAARRRIRRIR